MKMLSNIQRFCALAAATVALAVPAQVSAQSSENTHFIAVTKGHKIPGATLKFQDMAACKAYAEKYFSQYESPMSCADHNANTSEFGIAMRVGDTWKVTWEARIK